MRAVLDRLIELEDEFRRVPEIHPLADLAEEKLQEINEAYDFLTKNGATIFAEKPSDIMDIVK